MTTINDKSKEEYVILSPGIGISYKGVGCVALPKDMPGILALCTKNSTSGSLVILNLN